MPLELKLTPKLTYKLRLSPQMKLSLSLLPLPLVKLKEYIIEEIEKNPLLEVLTSESVFPNNKQNSDIVTNIEQQNSEPESPWSEEDEKKRQYKESLIATSPTLQEHLSRQLHLFVNFDGERKIGELIIGNIDDNGYLSCPVDEIAESSKTTKFQVEKVLNLIQTFDPIGVGARNLRECLLIQLKAKGEENSLNGRIVDKYLPFLEKKRYKYLVKKLSAKGGSLPDRQAGTSGRKVSVEEIKEAVKEIASLEPKPGRSFSTEKTVRLIPDAILKKNKDRYEVILNDCELPSIKINDKYKTMLKEENTPSDVKRYLIERLNAAKALISAIDKRRRTIQEITEDIVNFQKESLDKELNDFKPMSLSQIAKRIGKHKSTVSRTIANKYIQTPYGILELRYFLNSGIKQENGEFYSSKNIKLEIIEMINNEDKRKPIGDQDITNLFRQKGISVSRRTITKYRTQLKILPSQSRQE
ncbi:MAG: RNA polymerase factor sigma-54 [Candidatus Omnitrophota bacterium]|nr:RNA polymerase factor sigma-54 [Candidatus Omnitrophota bacterium]